MSTYGILFIGDVVGRSGRRALQRELPNLIRLHQPLFVVVNGENSAAGVGITPDIAEELFRYGADAITLGNHAFNKREILPYLDTEPRIVRPANLPPQTPGRGSTLLSKDGIDLAVFNLCGRVFMETYDDPFRCMDQLLTEFDTPHRFVDFHAEATSEKIAFSYYLEGRVTAVVGTHTHVQTADERVLAGGTACISDAGMTGPTNGVLGMDRNIIVSRFLTSMPAKFEVATGPSVICGVHIGVKSDTGRAVSIERLLVDGGEQE